MTCKAPVTLPIVANTEAAPAAIPVTAPAVDTVATDGSDDTHVAPVVMSCVVPSESVPVATNCVVVPTVGATPLTVIAVRLEGEVVLPHAAVNTATPTMRARMVSSLDRMGTS